jgi:hypothetical protein
MDDHQKELMPPGDCILFSTADWHRVLIGDERERQVDKYIDMSHLMTFRPISSWCWPAVW